MVTVLPAVTGHEGSQIPRDHLVIELLQALMLLMVISSLLPHLLTAWYSALYCPSNHSDIKANLNHFMSSCCTTFL